MPETITKDWITSHPKYKHLFQGIGWFNCKPMTIEMQSDAEPVWKYCRQYVVVIKTSQNEDLL